MGKDKPVDAHVVVGCVALVHGHAKLVQVRQSHRHWNIPASFWVEVGDAVSQVSKI